MTDKERLSQLEIFLSDFAKKQDRILHALNLAVATLAHHSSQIEFLLIKQGDLSEDLDQMRKLVDTRLGTLDSKVESIDTKVNSVDSRIESLDTKVDSILTLLRNKLK